MPEPEALVPPEPRREHSNTRIVPEGQRPCPICRKPMRHDVQYGVTLDLCFEHGIWLDKGELETLKNVIRQRGLRTRTQMLEDARRSARKEGAAAGWLVFLFE